MARRRWIAGATPKRTRGAFRAKARRAGMATLAYARKVIAGGSARHGLRTLRQAVLARTLNVVRPKGKTRKRTARRATRTRRRR